MYEDHSKLLEGEEELNGSSVLTEVWILFILALDPETSVNLGTWLGFLGLKDRLEISERWPLWVLDRT